jgi:hypothetical protein
MPWGSDAEDMDRLDSQLRVPAQPQPVSKLTWPTLRLHHISSTLSKRSSARSRLLCWRTANR